MTTTTTNKFLTADDLWRLPQDRMRHELVDGELTTMAPSGFEHGAIVLNLSAPLATHVKRHDLGVAVGAETGFVLRPNPDTVRAPDLAFVARNHISRGKLPVKFWDGAPDLAVEVVSPSDTVYEISAKTEDWLAAGAKLVWVVNPKDQAVTLYRTGAAPEILRSSGTLTGDSVIPGFTMPVAAIFE